MQCSHGFRVIYISVYFTYMQQTTEVLLYIKNKFPKKVQVGTFLHILVQCILGYPNPIGQVAKKKVWIREEFG